MKPFIAVATLLLVIIIISSIFAVPKENSFGMNNLKEALETIADVPTLYEADSGFIATTVDVLTFPFRFIGWFITSIFKFCYALIGSAITDMLFGGAL